MNIFKKIYCRAYQFGFRILLPILPYRQPKILKSYQEIVDVLKQNNKKSVLLFTDKGVRGLGLSKNLEECIKSSGLSLTQTQRQTMLKVHTNFLKGKTATASLPLAEVLLWIAQRPQGHGLQDQTKL